MRVRRTLFAVTVVLVGSVAALAGAGALLSGSDGGLEPVDAVRPQPGLMDGLRWLPLVSLATPSATPMPLPSATPTPVPHTPAPEPVQPEPPAPVSPQEPPPEVPTQPVIREWADPSFAEQVLVLANGEREAHGTAPLGSHAALPASAQSYSEKLMAAGAVGHDADGLTLNGRLSQAGYAGGAPVGELVWGGTGSFSPGAVVAAWLNSPSHAAVLLDPVYRSGGVGCYFRDGGARLQVRCVMHVGQ